MLKMREVCQLTGLTERAVRLYIQEELIRPEVRDGIHNKAYFFSVDNVETLRNISTLRNAGFSINDIKLMLEDAANISHLVQKKEEEIEKEIRHLKYIQETLKYLNIQEHNDVTKLADAIEPRSTYAKETPRYRKPRWVIVLAFVVVFLLLLLPFVFQMGFFFYIVLLFAVGILGGISFPVMSVGYFLHCMKSSRKKNITTGKVVAIISNEGVEDYIGESTFTTIRLLLTFGVIRWNDFRPDHWFPLIQFEMENGKNATSTFRYGGLKHLWNVGDEVEIAWEDEKLIYPKDIRWLVKKAIAYLLVGAGMLVMSGVLYSYFIK
ncbi:MAG: MerR family transcriptional regulator [Roseburia sp.]|nr:MerR family transcriptional regulator [Roseburia sp.]